MSSPLARMAQALQRAYRHSKLRSLVWAYQKGGQLDCVVVHHGWLTKQPAMLLLPLLCNHVKGKLRCPSDMTIVLVHNYRRRPMMEKSLRYAGIKDFVVLRPRPRGPWNGAAKLLPLLQYLSSDSCPTEYVLYCDSRDCVLRADPAAAIECLRNEDCDLLLSSTRFPGGYECMPQIKRWSDAVVAECGYEQRYLNAGVFVGRTTFVRQVLEAASEYVTEQDLSRRELDRRILGGSLRERLPGFPQGVGSDQIILRYLHPRFYPRMKIDYRGRLALPR